MHELGNSGSANLAASDAPLAVSSESVSVVSTLASLPTRPVGPLYFSVGRESVVADGILRFHAMPSTGLAVHFANAYTVALADSNPGYADALRSSRSVCVTDGMPIAWAGRRFYPELADEWERVSGADLMIDVLTKSASHRPRHYFLGGDEETLSALIANIRLKWPQVVIAGFESPPFRDLTPAEVAQQDQRIRDSGATHVWVGLGTPKQDWESERLAAELPVVALAVGAAFDFIAGTKKRAPQWIQDSGLEWAHRLFSEPRRLTKRYLWGNPRFVIAAWRHRP